jgi:predicted MFS family arabinose efflux permease
MHIPMTTLPMSWFEKRSLGRALGAITGGTGVGIIITGLLLPPLLSSLGKEAWRECWFLMALITFSIFITGVILLKERPTQPGQTPEETIEDNKPILSQMEKGGLNLRSIYLVYFIFGFAYNIYATYFVAFLVEDVHLVGKTAGGIWAIFGWMCTISGLVWGSLSDRLGRRNALLWNNGIISSAVLLPLLFHHPLLLALSSFLFGFTFLGTIAIIAASVGDQVGEKRASVYGLVTFVHGIGQLLGTTLGGYLKDLTGSFQLTLLTSLTGFLLCLILTAFNKRPCQSTSKVLN